MEFITLPAPTPFDGWFLIQALTSGTGEDFNRRLMYNPASVELRVNVTGFDQTVKDAIPGIISSYVDPPDTTKDLGAVALAGIS